FTISPGTLQTRTAIDPTIAAHWTGWRGRSAWRSEVGRCAVSSAVVIGCLLDLAYKLLSGNLARIHGDVIQDKAPTAPAAQGPRAARADQGDARPPVRRGRLRRGDARQDRGRRGRDEAGPLPALRLQEGALSGSAGAPPGRPPAVLRGPSV